MYEDVVQEAKHIANISRCVNDIYIHCDIVEGATLNKHLSEVLYYLILFNPPVVSFRKSGRNWCSSP